MNFSLSPILDMKPVSIRKQIEVYFHLVIFMSIPTEIFKEATANIQSGKP